MYVKRRNIKIGKIKQKKILEFDYLSDQIKVFLGGFQTLTHTDKIMIQIIIKDMHFV